MCGSRSVIRGLQSAVPSVTPQSPPASVAAAVTAPRRWPLPRRTAGERRTTSKPPSRAHSAVQEGHRAACTSALRYRVHSAPAQQSSSARTARADSRVAAAPSSSPSWPSRQSVRIPRAHSPWRYWVPPAGLHCPQANPQVHARMPSPTPDRATGLERAYCITDCAGGGVHMPALRAGVREPPWARRRSDSIAAGRTHASALARACGALWRAALADPAVLCW